MQVERVQVEIAWHLHAMMDGIRVRAMREVLNR